MAVRADDDEIVQAIDAARKAAAALGIVEGPTYTQVIVSADGAVVGELAARLGGGHDAELCRAALHVDLNQLAISAALGEEVPRHELAPQARVGGACIRFLVAPAGELQAVQGLEDAFEARGVRGIRIYRRPGHVFDELRRGADRAGAILALGAIRGGGARKCGSGARAHPLRRGRPAAAFV